MIDGFVDFGCEDGILCVGDGVWLDVSGLWSNLLLVLEDNDMLVYCDGGWIFLCSGGDLSLGQGSLFDVLFGVVLLVDGK